MNDIKQELKEFIIETLKLDDLTPEDISEAAPLFREGLGLDSIDALELTVALENRFKLAIPDAEVGKKAFASIEALAAFVQENRKDT